MQIFLVALTGGLALAPVLAQVAPVVSPIGVSASSFDIDEVALTSSRFMDNQNRTVSYLKFVDVNRLLYVRAPNLCK